MGRSETSVLVVDDERFFREAIKDTLRADGLDCQLTGTAAEAVGLARDPRVGVVVLDIQLPDHNGLEVLRRLRKIRPEVRVVVLSAHTDQEYVLEALRLGACDYLAKPIHEEELRLSVRRALETYRVAARSQALARRIGRVEDARAALAEAAEAGSDALRERVVEAAGQLLDAARTSLLLLDDSGAELRVLAAQGAKVPRPEMDAVALGAPVAGWVAARGEPFVTAAASRDPRLGGRPPLAGRYESDSFVVVPVGREGRWVGALCATERNDGEPFEAADAVLLGLLADALAARLGGSGPHVPAEGMETAGAADDAELARGVCEAITSDVDPERVLRAALRAVAGRIGAAPVAIHLADDGSGALVRQAQWEGAGEDDRASLPRRAGLTGGVLESGCPVACERPADDPRFDAEVDTPEGGDTHPLMVVPIRFRGRTLGVGRAFLREGAVPSPRTAEVLSAALSAAMRNVLLYRSLVESIEELARARREAREQSGAA